MLHEYVRELVREEVGDRDDHHLKTCNNYIYLNIIEIYKINSTQIKMRVAGLESESESVNLVGAIVNQMKGSSLQHTGAHRENKCTERSMEE